MQVVAFSNQCLKGVKKISQVNRIINKTVMDAAVYPANRMKVLAWS